MTPFHIYVRNYLEIVEKTTQWLSTEIQKQKESENPNIVQAMELAGRADSQRLKMREVKEQLDTLEKLCETLSIH